MPPVVRLCAGCRDPLPGQHLRVQLAPPHNKWHEVRCHDLECLMDFLEREENGDVSQNEVFKNETWINSRR